jgi:hypothetical protein
MIQIAIGRPGPVGRLRALWITACLVAGPALANEFDQAKRIHDRIAGVPPDAVTLQAMVDEMNSTDAVTAARMYATEAPEFYNVTLKNFAAPWTNRDGNVFVSLNDYTATIIGMVRDDYDFRDILSADVVYVGSGTGIPGYAGNNNAHYEALEARGVDLKANLQPRAQSQLTGVPTSATAGVMTTRAAAQAYFIDGTNRAMLRFTLVNHLCRDMEQVHDITRAPDRIRQDVSRSPGGDSRVFLNNCIGCHSGMDPLAQAFAYYDFEYDRDNDPGGSAGTISYNDAGVTDPDTGTRVESKYFNNAATFEHGFATPDDTWTNYWRAGQNALLGWDPGLPGTGAGAQSLGVELAASDAFARCQVEKVFKNVCLRPPQDGLDRAQVDSMVTSFRLQGYNLKQVFAESAVYCMGD